MSGLLATKLHPPPTPSGWIERPRLNLQLNEGINSGRQVTLVSAPAGFGKTTCVCHWLSSLGHWQSAWLSLDASDDDPGRFFAYLAAALQQAGVHLGEEFVGVIRSGQLPERGILSTTLINQIWEAEARFLLVLDDFHAIQDRFILAVFENLLANWPEPLHLVLVTREDPPLPLARLRANNQLTEIRAGDLRFGRQEIEIFLNERMGLALSSGDIANLATRTEGWVVGLQLAGLSMRDRSAPADFIARLSGSHHFILSYLTEEVLSQQPEDIQHFLLQTAILEKLNGDLCNAVTGRSDSQLLLEQLFHANLFLVALDEKRQWYRYHHLFADLLRTLQKTRLREKTSELHQRASRWYAQASGEDGPFVHEAIEHALLAEDDAAAVALLEQHATGMIMQGYARTVNRWVQALPAEWGRHSPRTSLALAWMHLLQGSYAQAGQHLEEVEAIFTDSQMSGADRQAFEAEWLVMHSLLLTRAGKTQESLALADKSLKLALQDDSRLLALAYFGLAGAYQASDRYDRTVEAYQKALQYGRSAANSIAEIMSTSGLAQLALERGQLQMAFEITSPISAQIESSGALPPISTVIYGILGEVCYQWHQIEQAGHYIQRALQLSVLGGFNSGMISCRVLLARLRLLEGDLSGAWDEIHKSVAQIQADTPQYVQKEALAHQARICLANKRPAAAELALQSQGFFFREIFQFPDLAVNQKNAYADLLLYNSSLGIVLYYARSGQEHAYLKSGIQLADELVEAATRSQYLPAVLEVLLLRSQLYALSGRAADSRADLMRAVELGQAQGFIGVFLEQGAPIAAMIKLPDWQALSGADHRPYIQKIQAAFRERGMADPARSTAPNPAGTGFTGEIEPLTDRELDVLRLMAEGLKYKEIAGQLFISINTVRYHVKAVYGKLNVNNRTQALEKARQYQIL